MLFGRRPSWVDSPLHKVIESTGIPLARVSVSTTRAFCIRGKTCANAGAVIWVKWTLILGPGVKLENGRSV